MEDTNFRHLNLRDEWPGFTLSGLVIRSDGALTLARVPKLATEVGDPLDPVPALVGPAGVGVDHDGTIYLADPANHRILRIDGCDGGVRPLPCLTGPRSEPGQLHGPRGLVVGPRRTLYVADSGNHRIQLVDLATGQIRGIWGQPDPWAAPRPGAEPGQLNDPWDLAADETGFLYVVDHANARVQKFDTDGRVVPAFWTTVLAQPATPTEPAYVTATRYDEAERLLVLDRAGPRLLVYSCDGDLDEAATAYWAELPLHPDGGLVFVDGVLHIGDPSGRGVLSFDANGRFLGTAAGFNGQARYLALDRGGRLLVYPGSGGTLTRLEPGAAHATTGSFVAGPIRAGEGATRWQRLMARVDLPAGAHLRFYTHLGANPPQEPPHLDEEPDPQGWLPLPRDAGDLLVPGGPGTQLWLRGELRGDGATTPALHQIRVSFDNVGYQRHLPAIVRETAPNGFLERALALIESFFGDTEALIDDLALLFDPWAVPAAWLDWLATWLALPLSETWDADRRRSVIAEAFARYGRRGTLAALREYVELYAGVTVEIDEPSRHVSVWSLGKTSVLGVDTMLAAAEPQGAVLGTTAVTDRSHLIRDEDYGAPLFESTAHRFCVRLREGDASPDVVERVKAALDREKPTHTSYELCLIGDRARVGVQARVGVDAYVARPPDPPVLGEPLRLGTDAVLPTDPHRPPIVGAARVGRAPL